MLTSRCKCGANTFDTNPHQNWRVSFLGSAQIPPRPDFQRPCSSSYTATTTMSTAILRQSLRSVAPRIARRALSTTPAALSTVVPKHAFTSTMQEDLQGVSSMEMLSDQGLMKNPKMRHFTGKLWFHLGWKTVLIGGVKSISGGPTVTTENEGMLIHV